MSPVRKVLWKYRLRTSMIALLMIAAILSVALVLGFRPRDAMWALWLVGILIAILIGDFPDEGYVEYWIRREFRERALYALQSEGFKLKASDPHSSLYLRRQRFRPLEFAILKESTTLITLKLRRKFEKQFDQYITPDMLTGGGRYYRRLLGRRTGNRKHSISRTTPANST